MWRRRCERLAAMPTRALRTEGRRLLSHVRPEEALPEIVRTLENGSIIERQGALAILGEMKGPRVETELAKWLDKLLAGQVPPEARLDVLEAARRHPTPAIKERLQRYETTTAKNDPLSPYRDAQVGGDAEAGRRSLPQQGRSVVLALS